MDIYAVARCSIQAETSASWLHVENRRHKQLASSNNVHALIIDMRLPLSVQVMAGLHLAAAHGQTAQASILHAGNAPT